MIYTVVEFLVVVLRFGVTNYFKFLCFESVNSPSNRELMDRVKQEALHHVAGQIEGTCT